jgi:hypothetical protein
MGAGGSRLEEVEEIQEKEKEVFLITTENIPTFTTLLTNFDARFRDVTRIVLNVGGPIFNTEDWRTPARLLVDFMARLSSLQTLYSLEVDLTMTYDPGVKTLFFQSLSAALGTCESLEELSLVGHVGGILAQIRYGFIASPTLKRLRIYATNAKFTEEDSHHLGQILIDSSITHLGLSRAYFDPKAFKNVLVYLRRNKTLGVLDLQNTKPQLWEDSEYLTELSSSMQIHPKLRVLDLRGHDLEDINLFTLAGGDDGPLFDNKSMIDIRIDDDWEVYERMGKKYQNWLRRNRLRVTKEELFVLGLLRERIPGFPRDLITYVGKEEGYTKGRFKPIRRWQE